MKELNTDFFFDIDVDEDNRIRNFFGQMQEVGLPLNTLEMLYHLIRHT